MSEPRTGTGGVPVVDAARLGVPDWRAAVRAAAGLLVEIGAAEDPYPDRCVATVEAHGPYLVIAPGVALAHARPEDGAVRLGLSAATVEPPVPFGHPENDPVDVVLAFCSPSADEHVGLLARLARALSGDLAERLRAASDDDALVRVLEEVARP